MSNNNMVIKTDEYDWDNYPVLYESTINKILNNFNVLLTNDNYELVNEKIHMKGKDIPLHYKHVYETILKLKPENVYEVGCGWGNHLANINILSNNKIGTYGSDISQIQIDKLRDIHPELTNYVDVLNITKRSVLSYDIIYTISVLMHLSDDNLEKAIRNITISANKYILLMENPRRDYNAIFKSINPIGWENAEITTTIEGYSKLIIIKNV